MEDVVGVITLLPKYEDLIKLCAAEEEARFIFKLSTKAVQDLVGNFGNTKGIHNELDHEEAAYLTESLTDKMWERINTGHFSEVSRDVRRIYSAANYFKITFLLLSSQDKPVLEKCSEILDKAILVGCTEGLYEGNGQFVDKLISLLDSELGKLHFIPQRLALPSKAHFLDVRNVPGLLTFLEKYASENDQSEAKLSFIEPLEPISAPCDVPMLDCPPVDVFREYFQSRQPALLANTINHWPALKKWRDLNYLLKIAGNRTVPVEIGSNYTTNDWSQDLTKFKNFLKRQFGEERNSIEYLAQHELFDQIPKLKEDIRIPDYCFLKEDSDDCVDVKAWLGPEGTISPLHQDPKHNILCQVFGRKKVILASSNETEFIYPHEGEMLSNTSQLDAENIDFERFPLAKEATFYHLVLQEGECLYIPPKWWHFVRSLSKSFSVSFWW